jgi:hypothetical protein
MPDNDGQQESLNEHVFELRYKPNAKIIDYRGEFAEMISSELGLTEWRITKDRVDVFDKEEKHRLYVGFRSSGYVAQDSITANYFPDKAVQFLNFVSNIKTFGNHWIVQRMGVRSRFCTAFDGECEDALERLGSRYTTLTEDAKSAIGEAKVIDLNGVVNFEDEHGSFNTQLGPMLASQIAEVLKDRDDYPEVGIYYDIDYWKRPEKDVAESDVTRFIKVAAREGWERHGRILRLILQD